MIEVTHNFGQIFFSCVYFQSKFLGVLNAIFDNRKRQFVESKWLTFHCIFMNLLTICGIYFVYFNVYGNTPYSYGKHVYAIVNNINVAFCAVMSFGTICAHLCRQRLLTEAINQVITLKNRIQRDVDNSFYTGQFIAFAVLKFLAPFNQCLSILISIVPILSEGDTWAMICWLFLFLLVFVMAAIINLYYLGVLCLWRIHQMNNHKLLTLVDKLKQHNDFVVSAKVRRVSMQEFCDASDTIDEVTETNSQIYFCGDRLRRALSFQTLATFAATFVSCTIELFCFYHFVWNVTYLEPTFVFVTIWRIFYEYLDIFLIANAAAFGNEASDRTRYLLHSHLDRIEISDERLIKSVSCLFITHNLGLFVKQNRSETCYHRLNFTLFVI